MAAETPQHCCQALGMASTGVLQRAVTSSLPAMPVWLGARQRDKGAAVAWGTRLSVAPPSTSPGKGLVAQPGMVAQQGGDVSAHNAAGAGSCSS